MSYGKRAVAFLFRSTHSNNRVLVFIVQLTGGSYCRDEDQTTIDVLLLTCVPRNAHDDFRR